MGSTRNRRPAAERIPTHTGPAAAAAADRIRRRRTTARPPDPDLDFFPPSLVDDEDLAAVVAYVRTHTRVPDDVLRAELRDRAILVQYLKQRADERYERDVLAILDTGHQLHAWPTVYGPPLGLDTRQLAWNRREALDVKYRRDGDPGPTTRDTARATEVASWLRANRADLLALADVLLDHRDSLAELVDDPDSRSELVAMIDQAGVEMTSQPTVTFASALSYVLFLLGRARPHPDPIVRDQLAHGAALRSGFAAVNDRD